MTYNHTLCILFIGSCLITVSACDTFSSEKNFVADPIDPKIGGEPFLKKRDAHDWARNHRDDDFVFNPSGKKGGKGYYFTNEFINKMQSQKNCVGLNFYLSQNEKQEINIIVVSVDNKGKDLIGKYKNNKNISTQYIIGRTTMKCPDNCDESSWLYKSSNKPDTFPDEE